MMECFAKKYCDQNEKVFTSTGNSDMRSFSNLVKETTPIMLVLFFLDTCYVLSFSIIMLNTSLHNPSVKDKVCHREK